MGKDDLYRWRTAASGPPFFFRVPSAAMNPAPQSPAAGPGVQWSALTAVLILALLVRVLYLLQAADLPSFTLPYAGLDLAMYRGLARRVAAGDLALGDVPYSFCAPYAYWLGALYALFGDGPWVAPLVNIAFGLGTVALIHRITLRAFASPGAALLAALGAALYGPYLVFDTSGMKTSVGLTLTALGLWSFLLATERPAWGRWLATGLVWGLAVWFVQPMLIVTALLLLWLVIGRLGAQVIGPWRDRLIGALLLLAGMCLALAPFSLRNLLVAGEPVPLTVVGGIHLYIGNHPGATGVYSPVPSIRNNPRGHLVDAKRVAERTVGHPLSHRAVSAYWRDRALGFVAQRPAEALTLIGRKTLLALNAYEVPNSEDYGYLTGRSALLDLLPGAGSLIPLGLAGLVLGLRRGTRRIPLYLLFGGLLLGLALTLVNWRYRLPLTLALWPAAGYALARGAYWLKERRWLPLTGLALLLVAGAVLTHLPLVSAKQEAEYLRKAQSKMQSVAHELQLRSELADDDRATRDRVAAWLRIARIREAQGDWEGALEVLREARASDPGEVGFLSAQVPLLIRLGEQEQATLLRREAMRSRIPGPIRSLRPDGSMHGIAPAHPHNRPHRPPPQGLETR